MVEPGLQNFFDPAFDLTDEINFGTPTITTPLAFSFSSTQGLKKTTQASPGVPKEVTNISGYNGWKSQDYSIGLSAALSHSSDISAGGWAALSAREQTERAREGKKTVGDAIGDLLGSVFGGRDDGKGDAGSAKPIVIDLDGDGLEILTTDQSPVYFDIDNDGFRERTAWVGPDDGLLVLDLAEDGSAGPDGQITRAEEIVLTELISGALTDLDALKRGFDSNKDGVFDSKDARWSEFRIWKDENLNGVSDDGELLTLAEAEIQSIDLGNVDPEEVDLDENGETEAAPLAIFRDGSTIHGVAEVTRTDGTTVNAGDFGFAHLKNGIKEEQTSTGRKVILETWGTEYHYFEASGDAPVNMALEGSGTNYSGATGGRGNDRFTSSNKTGVVLDGKAGDDILTTGVGHDVLIGGDGADTLRAGDGHDALFVDGSDKVIDGGDGYDVAYVEGDQGLTLNLTSANLEAVYGGDGHDRLSRGSSDRLNSVMSGGKGNDYLVGGALSDVLIGGEGNDRLTGHDGNDRLDGGAGRDWLHAGGGDDIVVADKEDDWTQISGGEGNDLLILEGDRGFNLRLSDRGFESAIGTEGHDHLRALSEDGSVLRGRGGNDILTTGTGDDILRGDQGADKLSGGKGNDLYIYLRGDGRDEIDEAVSVEGGVDRLAFGYGIDAEDVHIDIVNGGDLRLRIVDDETGAFGDDEIRIKDWVNSNKKIEYISFGDGTVFDLSRIEQISNGYTSQSISLPTPSESLASANAYTNHKRVLGNSGNNTLNGSKDDDLLDGRGGSDRLNGGGGDDVYVFGKGSGVETITDHHEVTESYVERETYTYTANGVFGPTTFVGSRNVTKTRTDHVDGGQDTILLGPGIDISDLLFKRVGNDIVAGIVNPAQPATDPTKLADRIVLKNWTNEKDRIEWVETADGVRTDITGYLSQLNSGDTRRLHDYSGNSGDQYIRAGNEKDRIILGAGNDIAFGSGGDDTLKGEGGHDHLEGGDGKDILSGGEGDDTAIGGDGNDRLYGHEGQDLLRGGAGNDDIWGGDDHDTLFGDEGHDDLFGGDGDDILAGGEGNDKLHGGKGDDLYFIRKDGGVDEIYDLRSDNIDYTATSSVVTQSIGAAEDKETWTTATSSVTYNHDPDGDHIGDTILFGRGIELDDLAFEVDGNDLIIGIEDDNPLSTSARSMENRVRIKDWALRENHQGQEVNPHSIERLTFADHSSINIISFAGDQGRTFSVGSANNDSVSNRRGIYVGGNGNDTINGSSDANLFIGADGDDKIRGYDGNDRLFGGDGDDLVDGGNGDDYLTGDDGNDTIEGRAGRDLIGGERGDDILRGGSGDDVYLIGRNEDHDTIFDTSGQDQLQFGQGIWFSDLKVDINASSGDLKFSILPYGQNDQPDHTVTISKFTNATNSIEEVLFANGYAADISTLKGSKTGGTGNDTLSATQASWFDGDLGNDNISGGTSRDIYVGGRGNDSITDAGGNDVYVFNFGDGADTISDAGGSEDTIVFGPGISLQHVALERVGNDLFVALRDNEQPDVKPSQRDNRIKVSNWNQAANRIEWLEFTDGLALRLSDIDNAYAANTNGGSVTGSSRADWIEGSNKNDTLSGGSGDDRIIALDGRDTLRGGAGHDAIFAGDGDDTVNGDDGDDTIHGNSGDDRLTGGNGKDRLFGGIGDDTLTGGAHDDVINGSLGDDLIIRGHGVDEIRFGVGDGHDTLRVENRVNAAADIVRFSNDIRAEDLWFEKESDDLRVSIIGTDDDMLFEDYFSSSGNRVAKFETGYRELTHGRLQQLISAMASHSPNDGRSADGITGSRLPEAVSTSIASAWTWKDPTNYESSTSSYRGSPSGPVSSRR
ncbi:calcium-binding protein [Coralliovum pocilloporae]|uniref:calcium-binding protein n=1 Tax=Coralliovum pocilloporae TaxID=3066369 RepID=UPI0033072294